MHNTEPCIWTIGVRVGEVGSKYAVIYLCAQCGNTMQPENELSEEELNGENPGMDG